MGRRYYVIVAYIWSLLFYLGLDPLKWAMGWAMSKGGLGHCIFVTRAARKVGLQAWFGVANMTSRLQRAWLNPVL